MVQPQPELDELEDPPPLDPPGPGDPLDPLLEPPELVADPGDPGGLPEPCELADPLDPPVPPELPELSEAGAPPWPPEGAVCPPHDSTLAARVRSMTDRFM